jgi:hypothetical protein
MILGKINRLQFSHETEFGIYLTDGDDEVLLPNKCVPDTFDEFLDVFLYTDSEDRLIATTRDPKIHLNECAYLTIKDTTSFGAFADWGLEKDLLIPNGEQFSKMEKGEKHVVYLYLDEKTDRLAASAKLNKFLREKPSYRNGEAVDLLIGRKTELGHEAVINNCNLGLIFTDEIFQPIKTGDRVTGYIKQVREDGKIDLSLVKLGYGKIEGMEKTVLDALKKNHGKLMLTDKSSPEEIKKQLKMSKSNFKKTIGALYKKRLISLNENSISLT